MQKLNIAVLFECSGIVAREFRRLGHNAISVDIEPAYNSWAEPYHVVMDINEWFNMEEGVHGRKYDLIIMHPPCTELACSGNRWYGKGQDYHWKRIEAIGRTIRWWHRAAALSNHTALENPVGVLWQHLGKPQYIQPWQFGHGETKNTGLLLHKLPELVPTDIVQGRENRIWKMPPSEDRKRLRSETFLGIAEAMAGQWSDYILTGDNNG